MIRDIKGLHHVTSMAADALANNAFFTGPLGLRRVKQTVNFDAPEVYHLYYGDAVGTPGSVMTYFPFPHTPRGRPGTGEVGTTVFCVPKGSLGFWEKRLGDTRVAGLARDTRFGAEELLFQGPDGDGFALLEVEGDTRPGFEGAGVPLGAAIHGFHSVRLRLRDGGATGELLSYMGYERRESAGDTVRYVVGGGEGAATIEIETLPGALPARQGAGSVHHVAFAVENRERQLDVRRALMETGYQVTPVIDRDYFHAIYFRTPGGVLFEVATNEPGFDRDEPREALGQKLMLPTRYEKARAEIEAHLTPLPA